MMGPQQPVCRMDLDLLLFVNQFVDRSAFFDNAVKALDNPIIKTMPFVIPLWVMWFRRDGDVARRQTLVIGSLFTAVAAIAAGRVLALVLPFRLRPLHTADLDLRMAEGLSRRVLDGWSSMPSDHAVYFMALAACLFAMNRVLGLLAGIHAILLVLLPRVYFAWHWPSDILVGALVGLLVAALALPLFARLSRAADIRGRIARRPEIWYPLFFFVSFQMATMFDSARRLLTDIARVF